jgi:hypothetical protein
MDQHTADVAPTIQQTIKYQTPAAALRDLAGTNSAYRARGSLALCHQWKPQTLKNTIESAWRELGEPGQQLVPDLVRTIVTESACSPVEIAAMALGLQGEDGLTELIALTRHGDFVVRWSAYLGFELAGPSARWAIPTLLRQLRIEQQPLHTDAILRALGTIGGSEAIAFLNCVVWNPRIQEETRAKAADALRETMGSLPDFSGAGKTHDEAGEGPTRRADDA